MTTKMPFTLKPIFTYLWILFLSFEYEVTRARKLGSASSAAPLVSAVLVFGDSTVDPGNNDYIGTIFKSNFFPYGKDFINHTATGRFSNGRLATDFVATYLGIKEIVPAYLDPTLSIDDLITGVSFASAGSGYDPLTPAITNVITLSDQLKYLKEYRGKLEAAVGEEKAKEVIANSLFIVSAGTNDFVVNYFTIPIRRKTYTVSSYMNFVSKGATDFLQALVDEGARRIGVVGLPPMGCLPIVITLYGDHLTGARDCFSYFSSVARDYNIILQRELEAMQARVQDSGVRIAYLDAYTPLDDMTLGHKYSFDVVNIGCCGTGLLEATFLCNAECVVCEDATKYVFWDSIHPTERSYEILFQSFIPTIDYLVGN